MFVVRYWKLNNTPLVIVARRTAMEGTKRKRENKQRDETFLASPSQSQMARDSGLFCVRARHKDGQTILFVVINWLLVGDKVHSALTWRRVLTQRRGKGRRRRKKTKLGLIYSPLSLQGVKTIVPTCRRPRHLKANTVSNAATGHHGAAGCRLIPVTPVTELEPKKKGGPRRSYTCSFIDYIPIKLLRQHVRSMPSSLLISRFPACASSLRSQPDDSCGAKWARFCSCQWQCQAFLLM